MTLTIHFRPKGPRRAPCSKLSGHYTTHNWVCIFVCVDPAITCISWTVPSLQLNHAVNTCHLSMAVSTHWPLRSMYLGAFFSVCFCLYLQGMSVLSEAVIMFIRASMASCPFPGTDSHTWIHLHTHTLERNISILWYWGFFYSVLYANNMFFLLFMNLNGNFFICNRNCKVLWIKTHPQCTVCIFIICI